jgi:hypothetical protein
MRKLLLIIATGLLSGCYAGALKGDDGSKLRMIAGVLIVCETVDGPLAAFGLATSLNSCPHQLDTAAPTDTDSGFDTGPTAVDTGDTGVVETSTDTTNPDTEGGVCGVFTEILNTPGYCQPWRVQVNDPNSAHTLNLWFEDIPNAHDLTGIKAPEAILAHCPDPNGEIPTTATLLTGSIEVARDNGRKATISMDTNKGKADLKFQVCR